MQNFCKLKEIYRLVQELEKSIFEAHNLSANECMALCKLNSGCSTPAGLIELLGQSKPRISKVLSGLEKKEFITRQIDLTDKRKIYFVLTDLGRKKAHEVENTNIVIPEVKLVY